MPDLKVKCKTAGVGKVKSRRFDPGPSEMKIAEDRRREIEEQIDELYERDLLREMKKKAWRH